MPKPIAPLFQELLLPRGVIKDQVYHALRNAILDGRLTAGSKIPSSRALAEMMAISRNSVISGFDRLMDEGYLVTRKGAGTFVCEHIPDSVISEYESSPQPETAIAAAGPLNPDVAALLPSWSEREESGEMRQVFAVGIGCTDLFPHALWGRLLGRVWRQSRRELGAHATAYGYLPLRQAISHYIQATRGVNCHEDRVIIVNGIQQALAITAQVLLERAMKSGSTIPAIMARAAHSPPGERWSGPFALTVKAWIFRMEYVITRKLSWSIPRRRISSRSVERLACQEGLLCWNGRKPIGRGYLKMITTANSAMPPALYRRCKGWINISGSSIPVPFLR